MKDSDALNIARLFFDNGAYMVPDYYYDEPIYSIIRTIDEFKEIFQKTGFFFVLHDSWEFEPFEIVKIDFEEQGTKYYIRQRVGGPTIDFSCFKQFSKEDQKYIGSGSLHYHHSYWSLQESLYIKAPEALITLYKKVASDIKKNFKSVKGQKVTYWISNESKSDVDSGRLGCALDFLSSGENV